MSNFVKSEFTVGEYAVYGGRFVARFKRGGRGSFLTFLCKNFTVEEYFSHLDDGQAPLAILQSKGYIQPHVKQALEHAGYPQTTGGLAQMIKEQIAARSQA